MNIIIESLFQWDIKNQKSKGPGIFGTTVAFAPADEEQGRKTLHKHIQLWVSEFDQSLRLPPRGIAVESAQLKRQSPGSNHPERFFIFCD